MPPRAALVPLVSVALLGAPRDIGAQWRGALEISGALLEHDVPEASGAQGGGALTFGGSAARVGRRSALSLAGLVAMGAEARGSVQGSLRAERIGGAIPGTTWAFGVLGNGFNGGAGEAAHSGYLTARWARLFGPGGAWAALAVGGVHDRGDDFGVRVAEAGLWRVLGPLAASVTASVVDTRAAFSVPAPNGTFTRLTEPATYADPAVGIRWTPTGASGRPLLTFDSRAGARFVSRGGAPGVGTRVFGVADLTVPLGSGVELAASAGRQLADLVHGLPASRFATAGVRLTLARARRTRPTSATGIVASIERVTSVPQLVLVAPDARRIEVTGTFTGWTPEPLERRGDRWVLPRALPSGTHRFLVRADGGPWRPAAGLPTSADEDGGETALLVVP